MFCIRLGETKFYAKMWNLLEGLIEKDFCINVFVKEIQGLTLDRDFLWKFLLLLPCLLMQHFIDLIQYFDEIKY